MDLFAAGTETTSTTTLWAFVFMLENPDVMKKIQDEIDQNVGRDRTLTNADRSARQLFKLNSLGTISYLVDFFQQFMRSVYCRMCFSIAGLLPYTEAAILEIQRCASLVPLGVPHVNWKDITVDGYTIPKGTMLIANLFSIHRDSRWWKNPEKFDPTRFLDENMKLTRPDGFAPFLIGMLSKPL